MKFKEYYKSIVYGEGNEYFWKSEALTEKEITDIQKYIYDLQQKGLPSAKIIKQLQSYNSKLKEKYKAERAYFTEIKRNESLVVGDAGENLELTKYRVLLSPHACPICMQKTQGGKKIFKNTDFQKDGYGYVPPFHPNCYCSIIPTI
jgi:hypothetical protein